MPLYKYCPRCGSVLPEPPSRRRIYRQECPNCAAVHYHNAKPCAGALIVREGRLLLGRRAVEPFKDWWDIPGGFLEPWEHPEEAVRREVAEETGLTVRATDLFDVIVDTYGDGGDYTLNLFYLADVAEGVPRPGDDIVELSWFGPADLPARIAFSNGRQVVAKWKALSAG